jgi:hypothetical protein
MKLVPDVVRRCLEGLEAEMQGRRADAHALYLRAWSERTDAYDACVAAHYLARTQEAPSDTLAWNLTALVQAMLVGDERVHRFLPSLHLNLGHSWEMMGDEAKARGQFELAAEAALRAPDDAYGRMLREGIAAGLRRVTARSGTPAHDVADVVSAP